MSFRPVKAAVPTVVLAVLVGLGCFYWRLPPPLFLARGVRVGLTVLMSTLYRGDREEAVALRSRCFIGLHGRADKSPADLWKELEKQLPGFTFLAGESHIPAIRHDIPFVYEDMRARYLLRLRKRYHYDEIVTDAPGEFSKMLALAAWVGTRWDHGLEPLTQAQKYDPATLIAAGRSGKRYWCEIAALVMVHSATAMGWPARLITASRDGYHWQHAVAEIWSNQYGRWFVVDADYNLMYMADGKPLSAYELCHFGPALQRDGRLRVRPFAPMKPSLHMQDLLPYYRYIHLDLRNDWHSRHLRRGSPVGGDLSTWWTARPDLRRLLTAKQRMDDQARFNWPVNVVAMYPLARSQAASPALRIDMEGYGPWFKEFQIREDGQSPWKDLEENFFFVKLRTGRHCLEARMLSIAGIAGPVSRACYRYAPVDKGASLNFEGERTRSVVEKD